MCPCRSLHEQRKDMKLWRFFYSTCVTFSALDADTVFDKIETRVINLGDMRWPRE